MNIIEEISKLDSEDLIEVRREKPGGKFIVSIITGYYKGSITSDVIGTADTTIAGISLASKRYHGNRPRCIHATTDYAMVAFKTAPINKYLCHVYYEGGNGHNGRHIYAENPNEAFRLLLHEITDDVEPGKKDNPRYPRKQIDSILIEAYRPLLPGQHPDTPRLVYAVLSGKAKRSDGAVVWESQTISEDGAPDGAWAEAFAKSQCGDSAGMKAVTTGVTTFGFTGTMVPSNDPRS